jgi:hypothetical protein
MVLSVSTSKESEMRYLLQKYDVEDSYNVVNDDSNLLVASAYPLRPDEGYRVEIAVPDTDDEYPEL